MPLRPGGSRDKGQEAEREVIRLLKPAIVEVLGPINKVVLTRNLNQTREGGHDVFGLDWLPLEVKRQEYISDGELDRWWAQTVRQAEKVSGIPVLVYRKSRQPWRVVMMGRVGELEARVTIRWEQFVEWFKVELKKQHEENGDLKVEVM